MSMKTEARFRILVDAPLEDVIYAVQRGRTGLLAPAKSSKKELVFEFPLTIADLDATPPRLTGEFAQGPPERRFVYVNSGTLAGQATSCWTRRAKVPLHGIEKRTLERLTTRPGAVLETRIPGKAKDGGPACATVPLLAAWTLVDDI